MILYDKWLRKENNPPNKESFIACYECGGREKLDDIGRENLGSSHPLKMISVAPLEAPKPRDVGDLLTLGDLKDAVDKDPSTKKASPRVMAEWVYVGDLWWCRKVGGNYEFARYVAVNRRSRNVADLWSEKKHGFRKAPPVVFMGTKRGVIVGHNEFGLMVKWDNGPTSPAQYVDLEFDEDEVRVRYEKILSRISRKSKHRSR